MLGFDSHEYDSSCYFRNRENWKSTKGENRTMKKLFFFVTLVLFVLVSFSVHAEIITIVGTGSGPLILKEIAKVFSQNNPGTHIVVPRSIGSGGGIKAVGKDEFLLARVARKIKPAEEHYHLVYTPIALVPIVFYTNPSVQVTNLTTEQVCDIYSGKIFTWQQVGGHHARIRVVVRQEGDSSLNVLLKSFPGFKDISITKLAKTTFSDLDTIETVEKVPDSIAFGAYSDVKNRELIVPNIEKVSPTDAGYPYFGTLALVYKEENRKKSSINKFIEFATSAAAVKAIKNAGGLPIR